MSLTVEEAQKIALAEALLKANNKKRDDGVDIANTVFTGHVFYDCGNPIEAKSFWDGKAPELWQSKDFNTQNNRILISGIRMSDTLIFNTETGSAIRHALMQQYFKNNARLVISGNNGTVLDMPIAYFYKEQHVQISNTTGVTAPYIGTDYSVAPYFKFPVPIELVKGQEYKVELKVPPKLRTGAYNIDVQPYIPDAPVGTPGQGYYVRLDLIGNKAYVNA